VVLAAAARPPALSWSPIRSRAPAVPVREEDDMKRRTGGRAAAGAALWAALAAGCGSGGGGGAPAPGPSAEPALASDDDLGGWVEDAALIVVTDHCAGALSLQMDGPAGRLRLDDDDAIPATARAETCRVEERFEDEEEGS
jgi:hypothetical protein